MYQVILRTSDKRAVYYNTPQKVNFKEVTELIEKKRGISRGSIALKYNGEEQNGDFELDLENKHHIVHVIDGSKVSGEKVVVDVNLGTFGRKKAMEVESDMSVKQFIREILKSVPEKEGAKQPSEEEAEVVYMGKVLDGNSKLRDAKIIDNSDVNVLLGTNYTEPWDTTQISDELQQMMDLAVLVEKTRTKYNMLTPNIDALITAGFINSLRKRYETLRPNKVYQQWGPYNEPYSPPSSAQNSEDEGEEEQE